MNIKTVSLRPYKAFYTHYGARSGFLIHFINDEGKEAFGDIAPLPSWSRESFAEAFAECQSKKHLFLETDWNLKTYPQELKRFGLCPSVSFGCESALLELLDPIPPSKIKISALLMGTYEEILRQAFLRKEEGFSSAKLKVKNLSFSEAEKLIHTLKDLFFLRIDVNRAWNSKDALSFFSQFPLTTFDYVEEPFKDFKNLKEFPHPLAIDESFPQDLSLKDVEKIPSLKALIYKPTVQGGMSHLYPLYVWTKKRNIQLVFSGSFESHYGIMQIASMAERLSLKEPLGLGTYHHLEKFSWEEAPLS